MNITQHELKTVPPFFEQVLSGAKRCEIRYNDRDFKAGDLLQLKEWIPSAQRYTGRWVTAYVTHLTDGKLLAQDVRIGDDRMPIGRGWVVMSIKVVHVHATRNPGKLRRA